MSASDDRHWVWSDDGQGCHLLALTGKCDNELGTVEVDPVDWTCRLIVPQFDLDTRNCHSGEEFRRYAIDGVRQLLVAMVAEIDRLEKEP